MKLIKYSFSAVNAVSSPLCTGPLPRIEMSFFLLSISTDELKSATDIITLLPNPLPLENKKLPLASNPIPQSEYLYLSDQHWQST